VLDRHAGGTIRVVGSMHSWSDDTVSDDVILDLRQFDQVAIETRDGEIWATVGAGCVLSDALALQPAALGGDPRGVDPVARAGLGDRR
jgi:hypothetical protein